MGGHVDLLGILRCCLQRQSGDEASDNGVYLFFMNASHFVGIVMAKQGINCTIVDFN